MAFPVKLILDGATPYAGVTSGTSAVVNVEGGSTNVTLTLTSVGTTSGGTVLIEESDDPGTVATWSVLQTILASSFTGGAKVCVHLNLGAGMNVRARISSAITGGGTIYVSAAGN